MSDRPILIIPTGRVCWGCKDLLVDRIPMVGEDFICNKDNPSVPPCIGRIRKIMEGSIFPREIVKGCYNGRC